MNISGRENLPGRAFMLLAALLTGLIAVLTVPIGDDVYLIDICQKKFPYGISLQGLLDYFSLHYNNVNGRLFDKIAVFADLLPAWLYGCLFAATFWTIMRGICRLADSRGAGLTLVCTSALVLFLPWYDAGFTRAMYLNYLLPLAISIWWIIWFTDSDKDSGQLILLFIYSMLAGSSHEGFSFILGGALALSVWLIWPLNRRQWVMTTGLIAGILFILLSPGLWDRVKNDLVEHPFVPALLIVGGNIAWLYLILLGWKVIGIFRRKNSFTRHQWFLHSLIACTILATAAGCWRVQGISPVYRLWWLASALSVAGLVILLKPYLKGIFFKFLAISMGVCALINLGYSAYIQSRLCREFHDVIALFRASPDGYVYFDLKYPGRPYLLSMRKVQRNLFFDDWDTGYGDIYRTDGNALGILPTYFRSDAWQDSLPQQPGAVINSGGHLIARLPDIVRKSDAWLYVTDNSGREITLRVQQVPLPGVIGYAYLRPYWDYRGEMTDLQPIRCFADSQEGEN